MYLFFCVNGYFFALDTVLVKKVNIFSQKLIENNKILVDDKEYEVFEGSFFLKLEKGVGLFKKNILIINSKKGYQYGLIVDTVEGFFEVEKVKLINKVGLLDKYGYQIIDFAVRFEDKLVFVFYDEFFDERFKELTCQK